MGSHTNYYYLVLELLRLKDEFHRIKSSRLQPLIDLLKTKSIEWEEGDEVVPSNKDIAKELGYKVARSNSMLKQLLEELHNDFDITPLEITKVVHKVMILFDFDEHIRLQKESPDLLRRSFFIELQLKETPRIGERIEFQVVPGEKFDHGIVHEVTHTIQGKTQIIEIRCHPYKNVYFSLAKQKEEYEAHMKWLKQSKWMNE